MFVFCVFCGIKIIKLLKWWIKKEQKPGSRNVQLTLIVVVFVYVGGICGETVEANVIVLHCCTTARMKLCWAALSWRRSCVVAASAASPVHNESGRRSSHRSHNYSQGSSHRGHNYSQGRSQNLAAVLHFLQLIPGFHCSCCKEIWIWYTITVIICFNYWALK